MEVFIVHQKQFAWLTTLTFAAVVVFTAGNGARARQSGATAAAPVGMFESHGDVSTVLHPGSVEYDSSKGSYTIAGSGENMWFGKLSTWILLMRTRHCMAAD